MPKDEYEIQNDTKSKIFGFIVIIIIVSSFVIFGFLESLSISSACYTIANYTDCSYEGGYYCNYRYMVNEKAYTSSIETIHHPCKCPSNGSRFYVTFLPNFPSFSTVHLDKPVPDSIKEAPVGGWYGNLDSLFYSKK